MKIGIYGGTFDPIHHGHLILARDALEQLSLDRVILIPNVVSPHKLNGGTADATLRLAMVNAAIRDEPGMECDPVELERGGTSYTIDTVLHMGQRFPGAEIFLLVGADNLALLHTWRRIRDLERLVSFVVLTRGDDAVAHTNPVLARRLDISSTDIRTRVANRLSIRYLVPESVRDIIESNELYREEPPLAPKN